MPSLSSEDLLNQEPLSVSARVFRHPALKTFFLGPVFFLDFNQESFFLIFIHTGYAKLTQAKTWCEYKITSKRKQKEWKRHEMNDRMFYREKCHGKP